MPRRLNTKSIWQDTESFTPASQERELKQQVSALVCYLWDNYLQMYDFEELIVMGVGNAYLGVKVLLINRGEQHPIFLQLGIACIFILV